MINTFITQYFNDPYFYHSNEITTVCCIKTLIVKVISNYKDFFPNNRYHINPSTTMNHCESSNAEFKTFYKL